MSNDTDWNWGAAVDGLRARLAGMFPGVCTDVSVYFQGSGYRSVTCTVHIEANGSKCQQKDSSGHDLRERLLDMNRILDAGWEVEGEVNGPVAALVQGESL